LIFYIVQDPPLRYCQNITIYTRERFELCNFINI